MLDKLNNTIVVCIAVENDGYHVKNLMNNGFVTVMPKNIERIPTVPFYHSSWQYSGDLVKPRIGELAQVIERQYGKINKKTNIMVTCPTDAFVADIRMLENMFDIMGVKEEAKRKLVNKTALLAINGLNDYVAVSISERLVSVELYSRGEVDDKCNKYFERSSVNMEDVANYAKSLSMNSRAQIYVFDSCNELSSLASIGRIVDAGEVMGMMEKAAKRLYKLPKDQPLNAGKMAKAGDMGGQNLPPNAPRRNHQHNMQQSHINQSGSQGMPPQGRMQSNGYRNQPVNQYANTNVNKMNPNDNWNMPSGQLGVNQGTNDVNWDMQGNQRNRSMNNQMMNNRRQSGGYDNQNYTNQNVNSGGYPPNRRQQGRTLNNEIPSANNRGRGTNMGNGQQYYNNASNNQRGW